MLLFLLFSGFISLFVTTPPSSTLIRLPTWSREQLWAFSRDRSVSFPRGSTFVLIGGYGWPRCYQQRFVTLPTWPCEHLWAFLRDSSVPGPLDPICLSGVIVNELYLVIEKKSVIDQQFINIIYCESFEW